MIESELDKLIDESKSKLEQMLLTLLLTTLTDREHLDEYRYRDIVQKVFSEKGLEGEKFYEIRRYFMEDTKLSDNDEKLL